MHETLHGVEVEVALQEFQIGDEFLILRHLETLEVLLLQELEDYSLLGIQMLLRQFLFLYFSGNDTRQGLHSVQGLNELSLLQREHCEQVLRKMVKAEIFIQERKDSISPQWPWLGR